VAPVSFHDSMRDPAGSAVLTGACDDAEESYAARSATSTGGNGTSENLTALAKQLSLDMHIVTRTDMRADIAAR
jgi:hypothetical protein